MVAAPCAPWHCLRGPVRDRVRGRPFNGIVRQHFEHRLDGDRLEQLEQFQKGTPNF
jgi:hypothetical protein